MEVLGRFFRRPDNKKTVPSVRGPAGTCSLRSIRRITTPRAVEEAKAQVLAAKSASTGQTASVVILRGARIEITRIPE
jgi:hypothetical protein